MDYYFGDHLRWNFGWETPNQAGAFLATLLPWCWALVAWSWGRLLAASTSRRRLGWGLLSVVLILIDGMGFYALARTYSRGALVALGFSALVWAVLHLVRRRSRPVSTSDARPISPLRRAIPWVLRGAFVAAILLVTGFHARIAPEHISEDRSSLNRLVLWRGGAELAASSPWQGWGWGRSGETFMHWTQPLDRSEGYLSMVNSYLTVAVEGGLPVFTLVLAVALLPLALVLARSRAVPAPADVDSPPDRPFLLAAGSAWAAWLGAMFFSNLWIIPLLWISPAVAAVFCLVASRPWRHRIVWRAVAAALVAALCASVLVGALGLFWTRAAPFKVTRLPGDSVRITKREPSAALARPVVVWVVPDAAVLGENHGQELRRWLLAEPALAGLVVARSVAALPPPAASEAVAGLLLCGQAAEAVDAISPSFATAPRWLLHPAAPPPGSPPQGWPVRSFVRLPGVDVTGQAAPWWAWAAQGVPPLPVELSVGLAADVRPRWPDLAPRLPARSADRQP